MTHEFVSAASLVATARQHHNAGQQEEAEKLYRNALEIEPSNAPALHGLGVISAQRNDLIMATYLLQQAIAAQPEYVDAIIDLANVHQLTGEVDQAIACYRQALDLQEGNVNAYCNLATLYQRIGQAEDAIEWYLLALQYAPEHAASHNGLGLAQMDKGLLEEAEKSFGRAIAADPNYVPAWINIGGLLRRRHAYTEALDYYQRALAQAPQVVTLVQSLAATLLDCGRSLQALQFLQAQGQNMPHELALHSSFLMALHYTPHAGDEQLFLGHGDYAHAVGKPLLSKTFANRCDPQRKLRIGYVSADFYGHAVASFIVPIIEHHNRDAFEIFCIYNNSPRDAINEHLRSQADYWLDCYGVDDRTVLKLLQEYEVDILVDLAGHSGNNRLALFASQAAPVQVTYLGYPDTTGLPHMHYRLTDAEANPPGSEAFSSETLWRLPHSYFCFRPLYQGEIPMPAPRQGIWFGSFNALAKLDDSILTVWAGLLRRLPEARLLIKDRGFSDPQVCAWMRNRCQALGIAPDRLALRGYVEDQAEHFAAYQEVDVALDAFPYNGATTTCETLWMGTPLVTLAGSRHASRMSASILAEMGLREWIAEDAEGYIQRALALATDAAQLQSWRTNLRPRMEQSWLRREAEFTRSLEHAYRAMWQAWCTAKQN